jgi:hypothetical protein
MKFISKASNLNIILRPGVPAQPLTGSPPVPTIFVKFKDGVADVEQEELIDLMLKHPGFDRDFVAADETGSDPYAWARKGGEVEYVTEEITHGQAKRKGNPVKQEMPPAVKEAIKAEAARLAKEMLPDMVKAVLQEASTTATAPETAEVVTEEKPKKKPKKVKTTKAVKAAEVETE